MRSHTPTIEVGGVDIPYLTLDPLLIWDHWIRGDHCSHPWSTVIFTQSGKSGLDPLIKQLLKSKRKKKIKIKQVKPVLHFVPNDDGTTDVIEYSQEGMKVVRSLV